MNEASRKIIVIGGGITGLSTAFYVKKLFAEQGKEVELTLLEKCSSLGGRINTLEKDGFVIEKGPDSFLARKLPIIELSRDLGIEDRLVGMGKKSKKTYILNHGRLHPMPKGLVLGVPTDITAFMETGLISPDGKTRVLEDLSLPGREEEGDESVGDFLQRRFGPEIVESIAEPLLAGIYAANLHQLSLQSTFPQFIQAEQKFGSVIQGMQESAKNTQRPEGLPAAAEGSAFLTFDKGLKTMVEALQEALLGIHIRNGETAERIERTAKGSKVRLKSGTVLEADSVILTLPTYALCSLLPDLPALSRLCEMKYVSVANVVMAFDRKDLESEFDGSGFLVPHKEGRFITACTWTSTKWEHTAPEGKVLLRCYVGRAGEQDWVELTDEEIVAKVREDARELMGLTAEPLFSEITRLYNSMPQYPVGHLEHIRAAREELVEKFPGVFITGAGFEGVGLPDCIRQGKDTAAEAFAYLKHQELPSF